MQQLFPQNQAQMGPEIAFAILGGVCVFALVALLVQIFYLLTLMKALGRVSPRNRLMEPAMVWLMFVPCLNLVWQFLIAIRVPDSLKNEFRDRNRDDGSDYGKTIALSRCIIDLVGAFLGNILTRILDMQMIGLGIIGVTTLTGLALLIIFWIKIANYSRMLGEDDGERVGRLDKFDDDDDDRGYDTRPRPRSRDSKPDDGGYRAADPGEYK